MSKQSDAIIGILWLVIAVALLIALGAGLAKVISEPTARNGFRLAMAFLFLGGSFSYVTRHNRSALRRFFTR